jgi:4-amino-4-deoxy-L-arabinose transferase-like glycosyltransferase
VEEKTATWARPYLIILATVVLIRLLTLGVPDLFDTTEGRYATTSQLMVERDDWVTPWIIYKGVEKPYLGKPPLHFWLINTSYELFGLSNFSARLPGVFSGAAISLMLYFLTAPLLGRKAALVSVLIYSTSLLAFILSGVCLVDVTLTVGITMAVAGFALADRSRLAGYLCFAGLALGVLVKGPVAIVFFGMAAGPWVALRWWFTKKIPTQMMSLPWVTGSLLFVALALPWYLFAESRNPGFLEYFIWTENLGRFAKANYGDEYGNGHIQLRGAAWVMIIPSLVPWSLALLGTLVEQRGKLSLNVVKDSLKKDQWLLLGVTWAISCPLLLIFARQYTATYNMSSIPGFAFLMAVLFKRASESSAPFALFSRITTRALYAIMSLTIIVAAIVFYSRAAEPSALQTGAVILVGLGLLAASIRMPALKDPMSAIGALSLMAAIGYGTTMIAGDAYLSTHRSTKNILAYAASLSRGENLTIGFAQNLPFSARFYSVLMTEPRVKISQISADALSSASEDLIIVRKNKGDEDIVMKDSTKEKIGELGRWRVYRRKAPAIQ